ncbi:MAG: glyoxalase/bleomycin resistance/extradiol dioxygenase family protein [Candidatus Zixiibacteriota bacterium]
MAAPPPAPPINRVIETCVYCDDLDAAEAFYGGVLGLKRFWRRDGRDLFFAVGDTVLLVFVPGTTAQGGSLPPHGATGSTHFALQIDPEQYGPWRSHLIQSGIEIEQEHHWPDDGARSLYLRDPCGNLVELITRPAWEKHFTADHG